MAEPCTCAERPRRSRTSCALGGRARSASESTGSGRARQSRPMASRSLGRRGPGAAAQLGWGVRYLRTGDDEHLGVDLARASLRGVELEVQGGAGRTGAARGQAGGEAPHAESAWAVDLDSERVRGALHGDRQRFRRSGRWRPSVTSRMPPRRGTMALDRPGAGLACAGPCSASPRCSARSCRSRESSFFRAQDCAYIRREGENLNIGPARLRVLRGAESSERGAAAGPDAEQALRLSLELPFAARDVTARRRRRASELSPPSGARRRLRPQGRGQGQHRGAGQRGAFRPRARR